MQMTEGKHLQQKVYIKQLVSSPTRTFLSSQVRYGCYEREDRWVPVTLYISSVHTYQDVQAYIGALLHYIWHPVKTVLCITFYG